MVDSRVLGCVRLASVNDVRVSYPKTEDPNTGIANTAPKHSPQTNAMYNHSGYRVGLPNHNQQK